MTDACHYNPEGSGCRFLHESLKRMSKVPFLREGSETTLLRGQNVAPNLRRWHGRIIGCHVSLPPWPEGVIWRVPLKDRLMLGMVTRLELKECLPRTLVKSPRISRLAGSNIYDVRIGEDSKAGMRTTRDSLGSKEQRERRSMNLTKKRFRLSSAKAASVSVWNKETYDGTQPDSDT